MNKGDYALNFKRYCHDYPNRGYGGSFFMWAQSDRTEPYNSFGNGSAMRASPIGWAFESLEETIKEAGRSAAVTHNHPEGIKGAQATAVAIFLARHGRGKKEIKSYISTAFDYDLGRSLEEIRPHYIFNVTCRGSVPEAMIAFFESEDFEDSIRNAASLGGDSDTIACIAGGIAEAFYGGVPEGIRNKVLDRLPQSFIQVMDLFYETYGVS